MDAAGAPISCAHPGLEHPQVPSRANPKDLFLLPKWTRQHLGSWFAGQLLTEKSRGIESPQGRSLWLEDHPPDWSVYIAHALSPLIPLNELTRAEHAKFVVGVIPAPWQISSAASDGGDARQRAGVAKGALFQSRKPFETLQDFCRMNTIAFCDPSPAFRRAEQPESLFLKNAGLFSHAGHALYARELSQTLIQELPGFSDESFPPAENTFPQARALPR